MTDQWVPWFRVHKVLIWFPSNVDVECGVLVDVVCFVIVDAEGVWCVLLAEVACSVYAPKSVCWIRCIDRFCFSCKRRYHIRFSLMNELSDSSRTKDIKIFATWEISLHLNSRSKNLLSVTQPYNTYHDPRYKQH